MAARTIGKEERGEEWSGEMERGSLKSRARLADNNGSADLRVARLVSDCKTGVSKYL